MKFIQKIQFKLYLQTLIHKAADLPVDVHWLISIRPAVQRGILRALRRILRVLRMYYSECCFILVLSNNTNTVDGIRQANGLTQKHTKASHKGTNTRFQ